MSSILKNLGTTANLVGTSFVNLMDDCRSSLPHSMDPVNKKLKIVVVE